MIYKRVEAEKGYFIKEVCLCCSVVQSEYFSIICLVLADTATNMLIIFNSFLDVVDVCVH